MFVFTDDKKRLSEFFIKDPVLFAYHIGDLDDFYFNDCQWAVTYGYLPHIEECILVYHGGAVPTVLAFGLTERFGELLRECLGVLPRRFFCHYFPLYREVILSEFSEKPIGTHWKMKLERFRPAPGRIAEGISRLNPEDEKELTSLYARAHPANYFTSRMLTTGRYVGIRHSGKIIAAAGVHVCSDEYKIGVLGNIATDPAHRARGLATALTSHLAKELISEGKLVCLNVKADNQPAMRCYEKLGFVKIHEYEAGLFESK